MTSQPQAALLPLHTYEVHPVLDALVRHAQEEEARGDPTGVVGICDEVADRVRELVALCTVSPEQTLRSLGLGRYRDRPQG